MDSQYNSDSEPRYYSNQSSHQQIERASRHRKMYVQRNSHEQQQIVIPYWDQEGSSHFHLLEQVRLLKKKNAHFEAHMSRMKLEYEQLKLNLEQMDENEKQHIRKFVEVSQRFNISVTKIQELKGQMERLKHQNDELNGDLRVQQIRQEENRKKISKLKDQQLILNSKILQLQTQIKLLTLRNEEQKKLLQKSRNQQLQLTKKNFQNDSNKLLESNFLIQQLKQKLKNVEVKLAKKQKQYRELLQELNNVKKQSQKGIFDEDKLNKQLSLTKNIMDQLKNKNIKLMQENNTLKSNINKLQQQIGELNKKAFYKANKNSNTRTVSMIWTGENVQRKQVEHDKQKQKLISQLKVQIANMQSQLVSENKGSIELINKLHTKLEDKDQQIARLKLQITELKTAKKQNQEQIQMNKTTKPDMRFQHSLSELEMEYNNELQALKRLILYKKYPPMANCEMQAKIKIEQKAIFDMMVYDYQELQKELLYLQEELILARRQPDATKATEEERLLYLQAIHKWQTAYQELHQIYQAKLVSKNEQINLLSLKIAHLS